MKLTVLVDNNNNYADNCLISEHGLSLLIEEDNKKILFDCGSTDAFIKNSHKMKIDLEQITDIVLSHKHYDHIGGFMRLQSLYQSFESIGIDFKDKNVYAHPDVFKINTETSGSSDENYHINKDKLDNFFKLTQLERPMNLTEKLTYLGEIPVTRKVKKDYSPDETALAYKSEEGLVIISGCSHSGIENIIDHAKFTTGENRINTIIGGLFLINRSQEEIHALGEYLKEQNIQSIYPCHCTDLEAKIILSKYVKIHDVGTGKQYSWT